jgi:hypothetical protein
MSACTLDLEDTHPGGSSPTTSSPAPVVVSIPIPQSTATAPSSPTASPAGAPTSSPTQPPPQATAPPPARSSGTCSLGNGGGDGHNCPRTSPAFLADVDAAIVRVMAAHPSWFAGNSLRIDWNTYYAAVVDELRSAGFCAMFDGEEIAIKNVNRFNEQYHVLTSGGVVRRGEGSYRATCFPAWF